MKKFAKLNQWYSVDTRVSCSEEGGAFICDRVAKKNRPNTGLTLCIEEVKGTCKGVNRINVKEGLNVEMMLFGSKIEKNSIGSSFKCKVTKKLDDFGDLEFNLTCKP